MRAASFSKYFLYSAPRQGGFEQVGGVALAGLVAGADQGMGFVDKEDHRPGRGLDLGDDLFEPFLEFALDPGPGLEQPEVEGADHDLGQRARHIPRRHPQGETLGHRGLADPCIAHQDGVVLPSPGEDVDHLADFAIASADRIDFARPGLGGEVEGIAPEGGLVARGLVPWRATGAGGARFTGVFLAVAEQGGELVGQLGSGDP